MARAALTLSLALAASLLGVAAVPHAHAAPSGPLVDRVAVLFDAPETGGASSPRAILERELAFEARLEALASGEPLGDERGPYGARHVRSALDRHIATELLAYLPDDAGFGAKDPCDESGTDLERGVALARAVLLARVKGPEALRAAMEEERVGEDDLVRLLRREAKAARYLDRVVAPMLSPSDGELRALLRTPSHPLASKPFVAVRCALRSALVSQRIGAALTSFLQTSRLRVRVRNALP